MLLVIALLAHIWLALRIDTEIWEVTSSRLPEAFDGFRVTLLTDIHGNLLGIEDMEKNPFGKISEKLIPEVKKAEPDIIAISGDLVDRWSKTDFLEPLLTELTEIAPTYYVTGNHEWDRDDSEEIIAIARQCGVTVLRNDYLALEKDGQTIVLAGGEDPNAYAEQMTPAELVEEIREDFPDDPYILMLYHRNDTLQMWSELGVDLVLSGHGHGGVVRLPVIGGLIGVDRQLFPDDCEGLLTKNRTTVAVSRGLGGLRIWNSPHLPTIVLSCG